MLWKRHLSWISLALFAAAVLTATLMTGALPRPGTEGSPESGAPDVRSIGAIAFGPDNVLFLGDSLGAALFAFDVEDGVRDEGTEPIRLADLDDKIAALLGTTPGRIHVGDMAVHPASQQVYLSVTRGAGQSGWGRIRGDDSAAVLLRVTKSGTVEEVVLEDLRYSRAPVLPAPDPHAKTRRGIPRRTFTIMDMAHVDGYVYLSGLSNEEFSSRLRRIRYPFVSEMTSNSLEIFHTAHGRYETHAPINSFAPFRERDETRILGAFSCTPLVTFPLDQEAGDHVKGTTVAELGAGNHPLDIISYDDGAETRFLLANHLHPFMRIDRSDIVRAKSLTRPTGRAGAAVKKLPHRGIIRLAELNGRYVAALQRGESSLDLISLDKGSL